ncbi:MULTISPECIES: hypothetical protein [Croceitalea]|uniref:Major facilitator superfamily (MFS) profile domain-containing protein n=1 Tax=Croceitalea vernalis TaxID=3075599 RepID=A0ABU3BD51_9FLAO|nr:MULTISPECIES: hypothetical protein [unclassified Croceitalea]MDT0538241.1 hypothetical protein [Croceitalea sp. P059]MDT0620025.1 hypothetical protein [Croceitalea sp. P007]
MNNTKKEVIIGFLVGLIANTFGTLAYILLFSEFSISETLKIAVEQGHIGSILALGAILNLVAFFGFLRIKRDYRARGVMIATILTALIILYFKLF